MLRMGVTVNFSVIPGACPGFLSEMDHKPSVLAYLLGELSGGA